MHTLKELASTKPYPIQECSSTLLSFYTDPTVFLAVFNFISSVVPHTVCSKCTHFECFMLTMMKLRLNLNNYDLQYQKLPLVVAFITLCGVCARFGQEV